MKRWIVLFTALLVLLSGCGKFQNNEISNNSFEDNSGFASSGVWVSFSEINSMLLSEKGFKAELDSMVENLVSLKIQNVYIHVRSYCDSLFPSKYFPLIKTADALDFDAFKLMIESFHSADIKVHAWINPYRVLTSSSDIEAISKESPAYKWLKDDIPQNDTNVLFSNGIYLNPSSVGVRRLVIDGIKEIINNYEVDGIHLDDYFYPTTDARFDSASFEGYKATAENPLPLEDWRRSNVNTLISGCYSAVKALNPNIIFSISPAADIDKNYNEYFADIKEWVKSGYVDAIIPQLYFGFEYPLKEFTFSELLKDWKELMKVNSEVDLMIGLAPYKIGIEAEADKPEWGTKTDIIARQCEICYSDERVNGFVLFSYTGVFSSEELNTKQRENLKELINS